MPTKPALAKASISVEDISRKYYEAAGYSMWITAMHVDPLELIASDDSTGKFYSVPVELSGETFTFGEPQEVAVNYVPVKSEAAAAIPYRWSDRKSALAAAGVTDPGSATSTTASTATVTITSTPEIAPDVTPAGAAIRKMAGGAPAATPQAPAADATGSSDNPEEATDVAFDAAKFREAFGLSADVSDDKVKEMALAALSETPTTSAAPATPDIEAMAALASSGQAVLVDKANLQELINRATKGELAYNENRRNERDTFLAQAVREGRIPPASLSAYERLWDNDPDGTRKTVSLLSKNIIPVMSGGLLGAADATDLNEADMAYEAMYGKGK
jgi:hypothetical protein